jgi:hypothetical protein
VVPAEGIGAVLPVDARRLFGVILLFKVIHPVVYTEKDTVIMIDVIIQLHVQVGEVQVIDPWIELLDGFCDIGSPAGNEK